MKCFTVTKSGVAPGIQFLTKPYPHIDIGDPKILPNYRRVEVDTELASKASKDSITECSMKLERKQEDNRRSSYMLIPQKQGDEEKALIKLEARCASDKGRTFYQVPRNTFSLAVGWIRKTSGPGVSTPVELLVLPKGEEIKIYKTEDINKDPERVFAIKFDGKNVKKIN